MELINRNENEIFNNLICFEKEIINPKEMKKSIDKLVDLLNNMKIIHKNKVITKVIDKNKIKKTITMKIHIQVENTENIKDFIDKYPRYEYKKSFIIKKGYLISISNNMDQFKKAVKLYMKKTNNNSHEDIENYDVCNNNIIEVSRIGYDGTVLGFDLYMENI